MYCARRLRRESVLLAPIHATTGRSRSCTTSATSATARTPPGSAPATDPRSWQPCVTWPSASSDSPGPPASPQPAATTPATPPEPWTPSASARLNRNRTSRHYAGALHEGVRRWPHLLDVNTIRIMLSPRRQLAIFTSHPPCWPWSRRTRHGSASGNCISPPSAMAGTARPDAGETFPHEARTAYGSAVAGVLGQLGAIGPQAAINMLDSRHGRGDLAPCSVEHSLAGSSHH